MKSLVKGVNGRIWNITLKVTLVLFVIFVLLITPLAGNLTTSAAGGSYTIDFAGADPDLYIPPIPTVGDYTCPTGRGNDPLPGAYHNTPPPPSTTNAAKYTLAPEDMALAQIVPFEIMISVSGSTAPESGAIQFIAGWSTETSSNDFFGYDDSYGVLCAFVDYADGAYIDAGDNATVTNFGYSVVGTEIQGTFNLSGLDDGDQVVVEVWVVLDNTFPSGSTGNVQSRMVSAQTSTGDPINTGNQTVPLLRVREFESNDVDLSITKSDNPDPIYIHTYAPNLLTYTMTATNDISYDVIANGVVISDTLDTYTTFQSGTWVDGTSGTCTHAAGEVTCLIGAMLPGETVTVTLQVTVALNAPQAGNIQTGDCYVGQPNVDLCNAVSISTINEETDYTNNRDTEPTDVKWLPTAVTMGPFTAEAKYLGAIHLDWTTIFEDGIDGFNIYRGTNPETWSQQVNPELIPAQGVGGVVPKEYKFIDPEVTAGITYYYWLAAEDTSSQEELLDTDHATGLYGVFIALVHK